MLTIRHIHEWRGAETTAVPKPAQPLPATAEEKTARLAKCFEECGRTPEQLCVLHCCGAKKLAIVAGWKLHRCGKGFWNN